MRGGLDTNTEYGGFTEIAVAIHVTACTGSCAAIMATRKAV